MNEIEILDKTSHQVETKLSKLLNKGSGLSYQKYRVLKYLSEKGDVTPSDIAREMSRERHNITTLLRRMQLAQLITQKPNPMDKRSILVSMTVPGKTALERAERIYDKFYEKFTAALTETEPARLTATLQKIQKGLNGKS